MEFYHGVVALGVGVSTEDQEYANSGSGGK